MREIHGKRNCPFAWRVRITAREKDLPFEWIPFDVPDPDPRAQAHNPQRKSPRLVEDALELVESMVILYYLDEAHADRPLQSLSARERALMRLRTRELAKLEVHVEPPEHPVTDGIRRQVGQGYEALDRMLADGRHWLGGSAPDLSDVAAWPFLWQLQEEFPIPDALRHASAYWTRARNRDSLVSTRPR